MFQHPIEERIAWRLFSLLKLGAIFQRGALSILEIAGVTLMIRSILPFRDKIDILAALLGGALIALGCLFEYLIWIRTVEFVSPRLSSLASENIQLRQERERLTSSLLARAPQGAFSDTPPPVR